MHWSEAPGATLLAGVQGKRGCYCNCKAPIIRKQTVLLCMGVICRIRIMKTIGHVFPRVQFIETKPPVAQA